VCLHQLGRAKRDGHACSCGAATAAAGACSKVCAGVCCVFADTPRALPSIAELKEVDTHTAACRMVYAGVCCRVCVVFALAGHSVLASVGQS
jgi:hypothetical protein